MRAFRLIATTFSMAACIAWGDVAYRWTDVSPGSSFVVQEVVTHPLDGHLVLRGQVTANPPAGSAFYSSAIAMSSDAGQSWTVQPAPSTSIAGLLIHPGSVPGVVFAFTGFSLSEGQLFRSADSGRSWSEVNRQPLHEGLDLFGVDPLNSQGLYALDWHWGGNAVFCPGCGPTRLLGVTRTKNDGVTWSAPVAPSVTVSSFEAQGPTPSAQSRLFMGDSAGVMVSLDKGATWSRFQAQLATPLRWIVPDPLRANVLYGAGLDQRGPFEYQYPLLKSEDGGATWREIFRTRGADPSLYIDPARPDVLWMYDLNESALYRSGNGGGAWQSVGLPVSRSEPDYGLHDFLITTAEPGIVYAVQQGRLFRGAPLMARDPVVVEYNNDAPRYWLTSLDGEAHFEDNRQEDGFLRTGARWGAWVAGNAPAGAVGSCRFWPKSSTGLHTRVVLLKDGDCQWLKADPNWILEAEDEFFAVPSADHATCAAGLVAVHRFHNLKTDLNHRWVTDAAVAAQMKAAGWLDEGVRFCGRPLGSNE